MVLPARAGSQRIPGKNTRAFNGLPMITWPISSCLGSAKTASVVVSTDSEDIAKVARDAGANKILMRPGFLATNTAGTAPVIVHAIDELELPDEDLVVCVYPTAAITTELYENALKLAVENPDQFVISVGRHRSPFERSLKPLGDGRMELESYDHVDTRTQDLPNRFFDAGKLYIAKARLWRSQTTMMSAPFIPFHLPPWAAVDLDEPDDWLLAEALHRVFVVGFP